MIGAVRFGVYILPNSHSTVRECSGRRIFPPAGHWADGATGRICAWDPGGRPRFLRRCNKLIL